MQVGSEIGTYPHQFESEFLALVQDRMRNCVKGNCSGPLLEMAHDYFSNPGKLYRPRIVLGLGKIFEIRTQALVGWAACFELLHNATLIHDDVQDGDRFRRGRPAVWVQYGLAQAINLGDLLMLIAPQALFSSGLDPAKLCELNLIFSATAGKIVDGQSSESKLIELDELNRLAENYLRCISLKTSSLFAGIAKGIASVAGESEKNQKRLFDLFIKIGNVFQMQDDVLDLYGEKQRESPGCDIKEGKVSVLVVNHLQHHPGDFLKIKTILKKDRELTSSEDVNDLLQLFMTKGTLAKTMEHLERLREEILLESSLGFPEGLKAYVASLLDVIFEPIQHLSRSRGV